MIKPRALRPGDRIAIVAPASPFARHEFDAGVAELQRLGFEPIFDDTVFDRRGYVAGEPETRAAAVRAAWADDRVAGIISARGGYGSVQVLPLLPPNEARRARKAFIGYSDLTSLLVFFTGICGVVAFHGPGVAGRLGGSAGGYDRDTFLRVLTSTDPLGELTPPGLETTKEGEASGLLLGGTLTQLVASLGTPYAFDPPPGYVLFLEEVNERPYRIDRMLVQLRLAGVLARACAVVFGELPGCDEPGGEATARAVVADVLRDFPGPVLMGFPSGHTRGPALTLPFGVRTRVAGTRHPALVIEEAAVE